MPQLVIKRKDMLDESMPSMSVFINKEKVLKYFPDNKEKELDLSAGKHILQLKCNGMRSRPYVLDMDQMEGKMLLIAIGKRSKLQYAFTYISSPLWILIIFSRNWWLSGLTAVALILLIILVIRKRQDMFLISEVPA